MNISNDLNNITESTNRERSVVEFNQGFNVQFARRIITNPSVVIISEVQEVVSNIPLTGQIYPRGDN